jgi:hypothetical protein
MQRGNPNWVKDEPEVPSLTEFELKVQALNLSPDQYLASVELRVWVASHKNTRYVPEPLLKAWGMLSDFA